MRIDVELATELFNLIDGVRQISRLTFDPIDFERFVSTINAINSLQEDSTLVGNHILSDYEIDKKFGEMIIPQRISMFGNKSDYNYVNRDSYYTNSLDIMTPIEFKLIQLKINGAVKQETNFVPVRELRHSDVLVSQYAFRCMNNEYVKDNGQLFVPISLSIPVFAEGLSSRQASMMYVEWFLSKLTK